MLVIRRIYLFLDLTPLILCNVSVIDTTNSLVQLLTNPSSTNSSLNRFMSGYDSGGVNYLEQMFFPLADRTDNIAFCFQEVACSSSNKDTARLNVGVAY